MDFNRSYQLSHYESRIKSVLLRPSESMPSRNSDWKTFRAKYSNQRPCLKHYNDLSWFKNSSRPLHRTSSASLFRTHSVSANSTPRKNYRDLSSCIGLVDIKKATGIMSNLSLKEWRELSLPYRQELINFCELVRSKFGVPS